MWPKTLIATAALQAIDADSTEAMSSHGRKPEIMADAAYVILTQPSRLYTGNFCIDEDLLRMNGVSDFTNYAVNPSLPLQPDFFIEPGYKTPQIINKVKSKL